jgi:hypothetical protein
MYDDVDKLKEEEQGMAYDERPAETARRNGGRGLIVGLVLIGLGIVFLWQNLFGFQPIHNWWALFILIPAVSNLSRGWQVYRATGSWGEAMGRGLTTGLLLVTIALIFLLDLDFGRWWPALLILLGLSLLLKGRD